MKPLMCCLFLVLSFIACHQRSAGATAATSSGISDSLASAATGIYAGHYSKGLLRLAINYISDSTVSGYDIHKGLRRNLNGRVEQHGTQLTFVLKEPGGNPYDGTFYLTFDSATNKINGKWMPANDKKASGGPVQLSRSANGYEERVMGGEWLGDLGSLNFLPQGVCTLEYYPDQGDNSQMITVNGSYEIKGDTIRIDWQRNNHTPVLNMKLLQRDRVESTDTTEGRPARLEGNGVRFQENMAG